MPRTARVVIPGCAHHVVQRGNNRQDVFLRDADRRAYLKFLIEQSEKYALGVSAYCLMTNHVHLVVTPREQESLGKAIGGTNLKYTQYINRRHARCGHLWQDRFFSSPVDDEYFWTALAYVERNPVRAGMVRKAWEYPWSSASAHVTGSDPTGLLDMGEWSRLPRGSADWRDSLAHPQDEEVLGRIRHWTIRGCPLGSNSFVNRLENRIGRRLRPLPVGRPKKHKRRAGSGGGNL